MVTSLLQFVTSFFMVFVFSSFPSVAFAAVELGALFSGAAEEQCGSNNVHKKANSKLNSLVFLLDARLSELEFEVIFFTF